MKFFRIVFDNPNESYFAGQVFPGQILISLNKQKKINRIKLRCVGRAVVSWTERKEKSNKEYGATEPYFNFEQILLGEETQDMDIILPVGDNSFPFSIELPLGIPSSFQGTHGTVQYFLNAIITRPWKFAHKISSCFTVNAFLDLNLFGYAMCPLTMTKKANVDSISWLSCSCCQPTRVEFQLSLEKSGFVPGEKVQFSLDIQNETPHRVSTIRLQLIHIATYRDSTGRHVKREVKCKAECNGPTVNPKSRMTWNSRHPSARFKIPALPPTNLGGGRIIGLQYYVAVTLKMRTFFAETVEGKVEVIIGSVPFRNFFEELMPAFLNLQSQPANNQHDTDAVCITSRPSTAADQPVVDTPLEFISPPPTYAEAMEFYSRYGATILSPAGSTKRGEWDGHGSENDDAGSGSPFNPRYATYDWDRMNKQTDENEHN